MPRARTTPFESSGTVGPMPHEEFTVGDEQDVIFVVQPGSARGPVAKPDWRRP
jgi:hypothetical protein